MEVELTQLKERYMSFDRGPTTPWEPCPHCGQLIDQWGWSKPQDRDLILEPHACPYLTILWNITVWWGVLSVGLVLMGAR